MYFSYRMGSCLKNNPQDPDPYNKTDQGLRDYFERAKSRLITE